MVYGGATSFYCLHYSQFHSGRYACKTSNSNFALQNPNPARDGRALYLGTYSLDLILSGKCFFDPGGLVFLNISMVKPIHTAINRIEIIRKMRFLACWVMVKWSNYNL